MRQLLCMVCSPLQLTWIDYASWCVAQAVSIVFFTDTWQPDSFYERIAANRRQGLHTLCLLDIKAGVPFRDSQCLEFLPLHSKTSAPR